MAFHQVTIRAFVPIGTPEFHTVLFGKALDLPMAKHRQARHGGHQDADAEIFIAFPELVHRGTLIRVVHEVYVTFEDFGVELNGVFYHQAVFLVLLIPQHIHESAVVDPVHAKRAHEITFHQPEGFGQQQRIRHFLSYPIDDFPPKFLRKGGIELLFGQTVFCA